MDSEMKKPREFLIYDVTTQDHGEIPVAFKYHKNMKGAIHVIEYTAIDLMQSRIEKLEAANRKAIEAMKLIKEEIADIIEAELVAREALKDLGIE